MFACKPVPDPRQSPRAFLAHLFQVAVARAQPQICMGAHLPPPPRGRTVVLGAGKAGGAMAHALEALWPQDAPLSGLVVTRHGYVPPRPAGQPVRIEVMQAGHPVPDAASVLAAERMLALARGLGADDLALCLMSGGGSALLALPAEGLTLEDKQRIHRQLLASGAGIGEMNCVRKHLSRIKGGRLAAACAPARVVTLAISDVPGDDPATIASGPTVPDESTCAQALAILGRYGIEVPAAVHAGLQSGALETPGPDATGLTLGETRLIAAPQQSLEAAAAAARAAGVAAYILSDAMEGESREVGKVQAALARAVAQRGAPFARPCVILSGGETTVTLRPSRPSHLPGQGGRAGEFCLGLASALQGQAGIWALAADTDGIDGSQENAGAFVTPDTLARAAEAGCAVTDHLDRNDAHGYFTAIGDLLVTGPTYTNVNDFRAVLVL